MIWELFEACDTTPTFNYTTAAVAEANRSPEETDAVVDQLIAFMQDARKFFRHLSIDVLQDTVAIHRGRGRRIRRSLSLLRKTSPSRGKQSNNTSHLLLNDIHKVMN